MEEWKFIAICSFLIAILVMLLIAGFRYECHAKSEAQGLECNWGLFVGCMVNVDGRWVDYDRYRVMK